MTAALAVVVVVGIAGGVAYAISFNRLVRSREAVDNAWADVDAELQRRHDLVPGLVETVRGSAAHEREVLTTLADRHRRAVAADHTVERSNEVEPPLELAIAAVIALRERYPGLAAHEDFLRLQRQLATIEDRIAASRRFFNTRVTELNRRVEALPSAVVARRHGFTRAQYFDDVSGGALG